MIPQASATDAVQLPGGINGTLKVELRKRAHLPTSQWEWTLHLLVNGPDARYAPGEISLGPVRLQALLDNLLRAQSAVDRLSGKSGGGSYHESIGSATVRLSSGGQIQICLSLTSRTGNLMLVEWDTGQLISAINTLGEVPKKARALEERVKSLQP